MLQRPFLNALEREWQRVIQVSLAGGIFISLP
jgi:hypothetical protein